MRDMEGRLVAVRTENAELVEEKQALQVGPGGWGGGGLEAGGWGLGGEAWLRRGLIFGVG